MIKTVNVPKVVGVHNSKSVLHVNNDFKVYLNGKEVTCYATRCSKYPFNRVFDGLHQRAIEQSEILGMVSFEADEKVLVEVESEKEFSSAVVRPLSKNIDAKVKGNKISFTLSAEGQYNLELDDEHNSIIFFFNPIKDFKAKEEYTYYFGAGMHYVGVISLKSGDKVYIDKDAMVFGGIYAKDAEDLTIEGYGVVDGRIFSRSDDGFFDLGNIKLENCKKVKIDGVIFQDSCIWATSFFNCSDLDVNNIKVTGQWRYNTDGIDFVNCKNVKLTNSYIHSFDDGVVIKAYSQFEGNDIEIIENIMVDNCVLWCNWGRTIEFGIETIAKEYKNVKFSNCDLIHNSAVALCIQNGNCAYVHDVVLENISVEFHKSTMPEIYQSTLDQEFDGYGKIGMPYLIWIDNHKYGIGGEGFKDFVKKLETYPNIKQFGMVSDVLFDNVNVYLEDGLPKMKIELVSLDANKSFKNITVNNLLVNGKKATEDMFDAHIDKRIENLKLF